LNGISENVPGKEGELFKAIDLLNVFKKEIE